MNCGTSPPFSCGAGELGEKLLIAPTEEFLLTVVPDPDIAHDADELLMNGGVTNAGRGARTLSACLSRSVTAIASSAGLLGRMLLRPRLEARPSPFTSDPELRTVLIQFLGTAACVRSAMGPTYRTLFTAEK
jgi:hypothetical protein